MNRFYILFVQLFELKYKGPAMNTIWINANEPTPTIVLKSTCKFIIDKDKEPQTFPL